MFETPVDTLLLWIALGAVAVAVLGVVGNVPTTAPPDAAGMAATIDEVTTSPPGSVRRRPLAADSWRLDGRRLGLRNDGGTAHARLTRRAVPVGTGPLRQVLREGTPGQVFTSPTAFRRAVRRGTTATGRWRPAPDRLTVRHVVWGGSDVTLVG
ncbi:MULTISPECIES: DUF7283 family protein [Haloarcula]|uniref:DUF7283 family protein n=1 Tax=Haloarcula TaxID=2237 RepID=UPI0023EB2981|nr:hypothetical protein [Halomicroarcula sp. XH51]